MGLEERRLAAEIAGLRREVRASSTTQQLGYSSIENGGRILVKDAQGREVMDIGRNPDGSYGATPRIGPTPPQASKPVLTPTPAGITVRWDGEYLDSLMTPDDFTRVEVHLSTDPNIQALDANDLVGTIESPRGGDVVVTKLQPSTTYYVTFVVRNTAGGRGPKSPIVSGETLSHPDGPGTQEALTKAEQARIKAEEAKADVDAATAAANAANNAAMDAQNTATVALTAADGKSKIVYSASYPAYTYPEKVNADGSRGFSTTDTYPNGTTWYHMQGGAVAGAYLRRPMDDGTNGWTYYQLQDGMFASITAGKITTGTMSAATTITTGDPMDNHTEIGQGGMRVYKKGPEGDVVPTVTVGGAIEDTIQIVDAATGSTLAGLMNDGTVIGQSANLSALTVGGSAVGNPYDPEDILWQFPRGMVAGYRMTEHSASFSGLGDVAEIQWNAEPRRMYKVTATGNFYKTNTGVYRVQLRYSSDGSDPASYTGTVNQLAMGMFSTTTNGMAARATMPGCIFAVVPCTLRVVLLVENISGGGTVRYHYDPPGYLLVEDIGPIPEVTSETWADGAMRTTQGGATAPGTANSAKRTYTKTYTALWSRTWRDGGIRNDTPDMVQGTYGGRDNRAAVGFGSQMVSDLSGATIKSASIRLSASSWYYSSGGTAVLSAHNQVSAPSSFPSGGSPKVNAVWTTKAGTKSIPVPSSWYSALQSGALRGITLGDGIGSSSSYYGRFYGASAGTSVRPRLTITYVK